MLATQFSQTIGLLTFVFLFYLTAEIALGRFKVRGISAHNWALDIGCLLTGRFLATPTHTFLMAAIPSVLLPASAGALADTHWTLKVLAFLLFEDLVQYWWHRGCHTIGPLWPTHMAHHSAPYMGTRMSLRNGLAYQVLLPNRYTAGMLIYLGFGDVYVWYSTIKTTITAGAHSEIRWDAFLYRYRALRPLVWVLQRTISTPTTHFAHHARDNDDGIGNSRGNFGNLLFFWDVLFGTARITQQYPKAFGLKLAPGAQEAPWQVQLLYPLFRAKSPLETHPSSGNAGTGTRGQCDQSP